MDLIFTFYGLTLSPCFILRLLKSIKMERLAA